MPERKNIALFIETSSCYGRQILEGIAKHIRLDESWSIFLEERDLAHRPPKWFASWKGHGIITRTMNQEFSKSILNSGIPTVDLTDRGPDFGFHKVICDNREIARLAADDLVERGFRNFAFCGFEEETWSIEREFYFVERVNEMGFETNIFRSPWFSHSASGWMKVMDRMCEWLTSLPRPVAIMAANDVRGQHLLNAAGIAGLKVPEEVAVIGVDNDELQCQLLSPPLSSVQPNAAKIGYLAAQTLAELMDCNAGSQESSFPCLQIVPPLGVVTRQSTDIVAIDDPEISAAISFIRENACSGIKVDDILEVIPISRSALERGFRKFLGRSPQQEIRKIQIKRAIELLSESDLALDRIALHCGFKHPEYMHVVFKREIGCTPGSFRRDASLGTIKH